MSNYNYATHNCSSLVSTIRANARALQAEMDKCRAERAALHRETLDLVGKEFAELGKQLQQLNLKIGLVPQQEPAGTAVQTVQAQVASVPALTLNPMAKQTVPQTGVIAVEPDERDDEQDEFDELDNFY